MDDMGDSIFDKKEIKPCAYDDQLKIMIHRFDSGSCRCRCGERIIRKPKKRVRTKFGREIAD
jgi:hypothetical protein